MLSLLFDEKYSSKNWSIRNHINDLPCMLLQLRLRSTTSRLPRNLLEYKKFKANELRTLLLFGHIIFSEARNHIYYSGNGIFGTELSAQNVQHGSIKHKEFSARRFFSTEMFSSNEIQRKMLSQLHKTNCL